MTACCQAMLATIKSRKRNPAMLDTTMRALQIFKVFNTYPYEVQDRGLNWSQSDSSTNQNRVII